MAEDRAAVVAHHTATVKSRAVNQAKSLHRREVQNFLKVSPTLVARIQIHSTVKDHQAMRY